MYSVSKITTIAAAAFLIPSPAFAYFDPAVGSMLLQGIIGAIAVAGTAWYTLRQKITEIFANAKAALAARSPSQK